MTTTSKEDSRIAYLTTSAWLLSRREARVKNSTRRGDPIPEEPRVSRETRPNWTADVQIDRPNGKEAAESPGPSDPNVPARNAMPLRVHLASGANRRRLLRQAGGHSPIRLGRARTEPRAPLRGAVNAVRVFTATPRERHVSRETVRAKPIVPRLPEVAPGEGRRFGSDGPPGVTTVGLAPVPTPMAHAARWHPRVVASTLGAIAPGPIRAAGASAPDAPPRKMRSSIQHPTVRSVSPRPRAACAAPGDEVGPAAEAQTRRPRIFEESARVVPMSPRLRNPGPNMFHVKPSARRPIVEVS